MDAIAEVIEERIKDLTPNEAAELVLAHGIPAGPIMNIKEILNDPHVKEREMFVEMDHPTLGKVTVNGCAIKLMDTKPSVRTPAPQLGLNNRDVYKRQVPGRSRILPPRDRSAPRWKVPRNCSTARSQCAEALWSLEPPACIADLLQATYLRRLHLMFMVVYAKIKKGV